MNETDWIPALSFLGVGLVLGIVLLWRVRRTPAPPESKKSEEIRDLLAQRDLLLARLREMGEPRGEEAQASSQERARLERECAAILRSLEGKGVAAESPSFKVDVGRAEDTSAPTSALRGFVVGVSVVVILGGLLYFASHSSAPSSQSGSMEAGGSASDADVEALKARVAAEPDDIEARLDLARLQLHQQDMMAVFEHTQYVLEREPHNPRAMSYQALVRFAMGQGDQALAMLREATTRDPNLLDGWVHLLFVESQMGQMEAAQKDLVEAVSHFPQHEARLRELVEGMAPQPDQAAQSAAPVSSGPGAAVAEESSIAGQIDAVDEVRALIQPGSVIFLSLRPAGETSGMPLAAKKLSADRLPVAFEIGAADAMMGGGGLPPTVNLEARLDADGDPSSRSPSDPAARVDGVALGSGGVRLLIQMPKKQ